MKKEEQTIENIMTKDPISFHPNMIMLDIVDIIENSDFHHFPVVNDEGVCEGVLSKSDYLQIQDEFTKFGHSTAEVNNRMIMRSRLVSEVMTSPAVAVKVTDSLSTVVDLFIENKYRSVIITEGGKCVGIVTPIDILKSISKKDLVVA